MFALIKSKPATFRRAGLQFNKQGTKVDLDTLTEAQVQAIYAEPNLSVTLLALPENNPRESNTQPPVGSGEPANLPATAVAAGNVAGSAPKAPKPVKAKA